MNPTTISESLNKTFSLNKPEGRIVFWHDPGGEFAGLIEDLDLEGVQTINIDQIPALELKIRLEIEDTSGKYLLYSTNERPAPESDWLLSLRLHSSNFSADSAAIAAQELGLTNLRLIEHLRKRKAFLNSVGRQENLRRLTLPTDSEPDIDLKMICVVCGVAQPDFLEILIRLFEESYPESGEPKVLSPIMDQIVKFDLELSLWRFIQERLGYSTDKPNLKDLLIRLFVTDFVKSLNGHTPPSLSHLEIKDKVGSQNTCVFLSQWRNNIQRRQIYDYIASQIESELNLGPFLENIDEKVIGKVMTFESVEKRLIKLIRDDLINNISIRTDELRKLTRIRRDGHWANPAIKTDHEPVNIYSIAYDALEAACEVFELRRAYGDTLTFESAQSLWKSYSVNMFRLDQLYRLFVESSSQVEKHGWDVLKDLSESVEKLYSNWYLDQLSAVWGDFIEPAKANGLLKTWGIPGVTNQYNFYEKHLTSMLKQSSKTRVYVIISDAFRYEAAEELTRILNGKYRFTAELDTMLGVVPSHTALGMAALTPHKNLSFKSGLADEVLVDGEPFSSTENRSKFLSKYDGVAIKAQELLAMNKDKGREFVRDYSLVYIYHNTIDAIGDTSSTESMSMDAVRDAINDLSKLTSFILNSLNGTHLFITADHGFLYQETPPAQHIKSQLDFKPVQALRSKKRYILGHDLGTSKEVWTGDTSITANTSPGMEFWIPKGRNLFSFSGGSRFIHGGVMLQEIMVPVIHVHGVKGSSGIKTLIKKVDVQVLGASLRMVTSRQRFEFIQTEAVSERKKPRVLKISVRDGDQLLSNEVTLTFDSDSDVLDQRKRSTIIQMISGNYDPKKDYSMVLRDSETNVEYQRYPIKIDISFRNDFD